GGGGSGRMDFESGGAGEIFGGNSAGAEKDGTARIADVENGGFEADFAGAAVENERNAVAEILFDVAHFGWADVAERIGAGSGERNVAGLEEALKNRMTGDADGDGIESSGDDIRNDVFFAKN